MTFDFSVEISLSNSVTTLLWDSHKPTIVFLCQYLFGSTGDIGADKPQEFLGHSSYGVKLLQRLRMKLNLQLYQTRQRSSRITSTIIIFVVPFSIFTN
jgi:hypothetical protein